MCSAIHSGRYGGAVLCLALVGLLGGAGCTKEPERQLYKIGHPYTLDEFRRDTAQCTQAKKLDFDCMRARGWVDVSADRPEPAASDKGGTQILPLPQKSY